MYACSSIQLCPHYATDRSAILAERQQFLVKFFDFRSLLPKIYADMANALAMPLYLMPAIYRPGIRPGRDSMQQTAAQILSRGTIF